MMMFLITDSKDNNHFVDEDDYKAFAHLRWSAKDGYATRTENGILVRLHVEIAKRAGIYVDGLEIDHIDRDKGNCRRNNLRTATRTQSSQNRGKFYTPGIIEYKGVRKVGHRFEAYYYRNKIMIRCGIFDTQEQAARKRDSVVAAILGDRVVLNFPGEQHEDKCKK